VRSTWAINNTITWIKGRHQLKIGGEWRSVKYPTATEANGSGTFNFDRGATSVRGIASGNSMVNFLLGEILERLLKVWQSWWIGRAAWSNPRQKE
jgi:hypothetical protein